MKTTIKSGMIKWRITCVVWSIHYLINLKWYHKKDIFFNMKPDKFIFLAIKGHNSRTEKVQNQTWTALLYGPQPYAGLAWSQFAQLHPIGPCVGVTYFQLFKYTTTHYISTCVTENIIGTSNSQDWPWPYVKIPMISFRQTRLLEISYNKHSYHIWFHHS